MTELGDLKAYAPYGVSTLLVLSSVVLYFVLSSKKTSTSSLKEVDPATKALNLLNAYTKKYESYAAEVSKYYTEEFKNSEDQEYKYNYLQEELLKLLIMLDGVDLGTVSNDEKRLELKTERKGVIKQIQMKQKELDKFHKDNSRKQ